MRSAKVEAILPREESVSENDHSGVESYGSDVLDVSDEDGYLSQEDDSHSSIGSQDGEQEKESDLKDISFGALAEAQAKLASTSRKRKFADRDEKPSQAEESKRPRGDRKDIDYKRHEKERHISRSSKHAPTAMSSKNPVSRKRTIFSPPPAAKFRDPRFDATVIADARRGNTSSTQRASQNYAFLSEYQAAEVQDLKSQLKRAKDPDVQAQLKRQIMSLEAKLRNAQAAKREAEIRQEHKRKESQAIKEGKKSKPYFLKESDIKKQIQQERQDAMGKRARDKSEKRKKKREKTREARDMPRVRRIA